MTRPRDESPARCDAPRPAVADVAGIVQVVTRARTRADHLGAEAARAREVAVLVFDLDIALGHARALTHGLDVEGVLALTRDLDRALDLDLDLGCAQQRDLVRDIEAARTLCDDLAVTLAGAARIATAPGSTEMRPGLLSLGMMRIVVRVLPVTHRSRYDQEFRAELAELAEQPGCAQLGYALRQLARCWQLRRVLADALAAPEQDRGAAP